MGDALELLFIFLTHLPGLGPNLSGKYFLKFSFAEVPHGRFSEHVGWPKGLVKGEATVGSLWKNAEAQFMNWNSMRAQTLASTPAPRFPLVSAQYHRNHSTNPAPVTVT